MAPSIRGITKQINENGETEQKALEFMQLIETFKKHSMRSGTEDITNKEQQDDTSESENSEEEFKIPQNDRLKETRAKYLTEDNRIEEEDSSSYQS